MPMDQKQLSEPGAKLKAHEGAMTEQEAGRREKLGPTMQSATATDMQKERFHILRSRFVAFLIHGRIHNLGPTSLPGNN